MRDYWGGKVPHLVSWSRPVLVTLSPYWNHFVCKESDKSSHEFQCTLAHIMKIKHNFPRKNPCSLKKAEWSSEFHPISSNLILCWVSSPSVGISSSLVTAFPCLLFDQIWPSVLISAIFHDIACFALWKPVTKPFCITNPNNNLFLKLLGLNLL